MSDQPACASRSFDAVSYRLVDNPKSFLALIEELAHVSEFALIPDFCGLGLATHPMRCYYLPLQRSWLHGELRPELIKARLQRYLTPSGRRIVTHDLKTALHRLRAFGLEISAPMIDTTLCSHLLRPDEGASSAGQCYASWLTGDEEAARLDHFPQALAAAKDALFSLRLAAHLLPRVEAEGMGKLLYEVEMPLAGVLSDMEHRGIFVETWALAELAEELAQRISFHEKAIHTLAGGAFNVNSPAQLSHTLFEHLCIQGRYGTHRLRRTHAGFATDSASLHDFRHVPIVREVLAYRAAAKYKNTYTDQLIALADVESGRIHPSIHQIGTVTGRLSCTHPNLQNIPARSEVGREIRRCFRAMTPGHLLIAADYSQIELRLLAHLADEEPLLQAFANGSDVHTLTAAKLFSVNQRSVTSAMRARAKQINFGILYGMSPFRLSHEAGLSVKAAAAFIARYFTAYPKVRAFIAESIAAARETGYTTSLLGRRRPLDELSSAKRNVIKSGERIAINSPIQSSAADLVKLAMVDCAKRLAAKGFATHLVLQVHDELIFEGPETELEEAQKLIRDSMENALNEWVTLRVPLSIDMGHGANWLEAHFC